MTLPVSLAGLSPQFVSATLPGLSASGSFGTQSLFAPQQTASFGINGSANGGSNALFNLILQAQLYPLILNLFDQLLGTGPKIPELLKGINPDLLTLDYSKLSFKQRDKLTDLTAEERAIIHTFGNAMLKSPDMKNGVFTNSVYNSVLENAKNNTDPDRKGLGNKNEVALVKKLIAEETKNGGKPDGSALFKRFMHLMETKFGAKDFVARYKNVEFKNVNTKLIEPKGTVGSKAWFDNVKEISGLNYETAATIMLWGHAPLAGKGKVTEDILVMSLLNPNDPLNPRETKRVAMALLAADRADDGVANGSSLKYEFTHALDGALLGKKDVSFKTIAQDAVVKGLKNGRTKQQILFDMNQGTVQAVRELATFFKKHPILGTTSLAALGTATAVCPFLAGLGASAGAVALARRN